MAAATATTLAAISTSVAFAASSPPPNTSSQQGHEALADQASQRHQRAMASRHSRQEAASAPRGAPSASTHVAPAAKPAATDSASPQAKPSSTASPAATTPAKPFLMYDSLTPQDVPAGQVVATYADGGHPVSPTQVTSARQVLWIDVIGTDPSASVLDLEPGAATPAMAPGWVAARLKAHPSAVAILYTSISEWSQVQAAVATLPSSMKSRIRWWIADPTGSPHIVPGSDATQWYWGPNYDLSTALPGF